MKLWIYIFFGLFCLSIQAQTDLDLAESYYDKGEFKKALHLYKKLQSTQPNNSKHSFRLIKILQELEQFKAADSLISSQFNRTKNPQLLVEMGYNYQLQNQLEAAQDYYSQALNRARENPAYSYSIALKFEERSLVDQAIEVYILAIESTQNNSYEYRLAGLYAIKQDLENMFLSYLNFTVFNPNYNNQILQLFSDYISDDASSEYNRLLKKIILKKLQTSANIYWNQMLSWLYVQEKDYNKALLQQKAIFRRDRNSLQGIIEVALLAKGAKSYEVTSDAFTFIIEQSQEPKLILEANRQLLVLEVMRFDVPEYKRIASDYKALLELYGVNDNSIELQLSYVEFLAFHYNKKDTAISFLKQNIKSNMSKFALARLKLKLADILLTQEQFNRALVFYTQVHSQIKNSTLAQEARFKAAKTSFYKGDFDWAESQLKVLKSSTSQLIANDALDLQLLITDHKFGDSLQAPLKLYAKAYFLNFQNKPKESFKVLDTLITVHSTHPIVDQALMLQAQILESEEDHKAAAEKYHIVIQDFSQEILADDAYFALAELYRTVLNDSSKAQSYYEKIIFEYQDSIHAVDSKKQYRRLKSQSENTLNTNL
ncbi:MAG: tetratricopeptide repeat protein [Flavobacteriaceae bacterium]